MKKGIKRLAAVALAALAVLSSPSGAFAAENLEELRTKSINITDQLKLVSQINYNGGSSDRLAENYFVYEPGEDVTPMVCYGNDIAGAASAARVFALEKEAGNSLIGLTNGDFFVMATGVSLGPVVKNGLLRTGGYSEEIIAFDKEGRARFGDPMLDISLYIEPVPVEEPVYKEPAAEDIQTQMPEGLGGNIVGPAGSSEAPDPIDVDYQLVNYPAMEFGKQSFNKTISKTGGIVIFTKDFGSTNGASFATYNLKVAVEEGEAALGGKIKGSVVSSGACEGRTALEEGYVYICIAMETPYASTLESLKHVAAGSSVEISFKCAEEFIDTENALGYECRLITDGVIAEGLDGSTRAPRTAAGIKKDGTFILYTADGRQKGYSMGLTYKELAQRMKDLGCVDAVNLDGGGSTQLFAQLPGETAESQVNRDSETRLRSCGNYIVFKNNREADGRAANLHLYPYGEYILSGASLQLSCLATDSSWYAAELSSSVSYSVDRAFGSIESDGLYKSSGSGVAAIFAQSGRARGTGYVNVIKSPDEINVAVDDKAGLTKLEASIGKSYKLSASAIYRMMDLKSDPECYSWWLEGDIGRIEGDIYYPEGTSGSEGKIWVQAGDTSVSLPVVLTRDFPAETLQNMVRELIMTVKNNREI